jgi:hypothetical protein
MTFGSSLFFLIYICFLTPVMQIIYLNEMITKWPNQAFKEHVSQLHTFLAKMGNAALLLMDKAIF